MRKIWPFSVSFLQFAGIAFVMPFLVIFYQSLGFSGSQIGILVGISPLISMVSAPFWTNLADVTRRHRLFMSLAWFVTAGLTMVLPLLQAFVPILLFGFFYSIFISPITSFSDSAAMYMLADKKELYGRVRLGGTFGFGLAAILAGVVVQNFGLKISFFCGGLTFFLALLVSQKLVHNPATSASPSRYGSLALLKEPGWLLFLGLALTGGLAGMATNNYLFSHMQALGSDAGLMGVALTIGTLSEIPVFFFGNWLLKRFKPWPLLVMALIVTGLRLVALGLAPTPELVIASQLLNGAGFSAMWMAGVSYADKNAPLGMSSSAQGLFGSAVFGIGGALGGFVGGLLLEHLGSHSMFLIFGIFVLAMVLIASILARRLPQLRTASSDL